jgi:hypothetical protein
MNYKQGSRLRFYWRSFEEITCLFGWFARGSHVFPPPWVETASDEFSGNRQPVGRGLTPWQF